MENCRMRSVLVVLLAPEARPARQASATTASLAVPGRPRGVTDLPA
jgi:hypothetical protein